MSEDWREWVAEADKKARVEYEKDLGALELAIRMSERGMTSEEVAEFFDYNVEVFKQILEKDVAAVEDLAVELVEKLQRGRQT